MKEIKIGQCPFCGGTEFIDGRLGSYGGVQLEKGIHGSAVHALVCRDCGSIVRAYVSDAEKLLPKKDRKTDK
ncbi:MAG: hypothetical protein NC311_11235 [Muribaculaceae bacterium]|nr:hypothetical protein [Muribaculaceae bacterium]